MRRRKRLIFGLGVVILACVLGWTYEERPPYRFLAGKPRVYAEVDSRHGHYSEYYALEGSCLDIDRNIGREVEADKFFPIGDYVPNTMEPCMSYGPVTLYDYNKPDGLVALLDELEPPKRRARVTEGTRAIVEIRRTASPADRLRAWLYSLRFDRRP